MQRARSLSLVFVLLAGLVPVALASSAAAEDAWQAGDVEAAERYRDLERERARRFREEVAERARTTPARQEPAAARKRTPAPTRHTVVAAEEPTPEAARQGGGEGLLAWPRRIGEDFLAFAAGLRDRFVTAIVGRFEEGADGIVTSIAAWLEDEMFPAIAGVLRDELLPSQEPALEPEREPAREAEREPAREARKQRFAGPEARAPRRNHAMRLIKPSTRFVEPSTRSQQVRSEQLAAEWQQLGETASGDALHATRWWQEEAERRFGRALGRDAR